MSAVHHDNHRELLREADLGPPRPVDAIIVPAGRTADHLCPAAQLASELGCVLLAMCSPGRADPAEFAAIAAARWPDLRWESLTVPDDLSHPLLPASASPNAGSRDWRHGALSTKRNLALLVARLVGWDTILFLDDDIVDLEPELVRAAAERIPAGGAVGLNVAQYPDNSVVCHANRLSGRDQAVFIGAAALVLDTTRPFGFFPNVYNEDWLFLHDLVAERRAGHHGSVTQLPYRPFEEESRARAEEFGEIIAEGLMASLHLAPERRAPLDEPYWREFLTARHEFVRAAADRLRLMGGVEPARAVRSLAAAQDRARTITARRCAEYVRNWRADLLVWHETLADLSPVGDFEAAARHLGLTGSLAGLTR